MLGDKIRDTIRRCHFACDGKLKDLLLNEVEVSMLRSIAPEWEYEVVSKKGRDSIICRSMQIAGDGPGPSLLQLLPSNNLPMIGSVQSPIPSSSVPKTLNLGELTMLAEHNPNRLVSRWFEMAASDHEELKDYVPSEINEANIDESFILDLSQKNALPQQNIVISNEEKIEPPPSLMPETLSVPAPQASSFSETTPPISLDVRTNEDPVTLSSNVFPKINMQESPERATNGSIAQDIVPLDNELPGAETIEPVEGPKTSLSPETISTNSSLKVLPSSSSSEAFPNLALVDSVQQPEAFASIVLSKKQADLLVTEIGQSTNKSFVSSTETLLTGLDMSETKNPSENANEATESSKTLQASDSTFEGSLEHSMELTTLPKTTEQSTDTSKKYKTSTYTYKTEHGQNLSQYDKDDNFEKHNRYQSLSRENARPKHYWHHHRQSNYDRNDPYERRRRYRSRSREDRDLYQKRYGHYQNRWRGGKDDRSREYSHYQRQRNYNRDDHFEKRRQHRSRSREDREDYQERRRHHQSKWRYEKDDHFEKRRRHRSRSREDGGDYSERRGHYQSQSRKNEDDNLKRHEDSKDCNEQHSNNP